MEADGASAARSYDDADAAAKSRAHSVSASAAYSAAAKGDINGMRTALASASESLRVAGKELQFMAEKGRFKKLIAPKGIKLSSELGARMDKIYTGDDILRAAGQISYVSSQVLNDLVKGKGDFREFQRVLSYDKDISTLVLAFYDSSTG